MIKTYLNILFGFDFGTKRIGVAVGQTVTGSARPLQTIKAVEGVPQWEQLDKLIKVWQPDALIVGLPLNMDGSEQPLTAKAKKFANQLEMRYQLQIFTMDERLSTKDAREQIFSQGGYKALQEGHVDAVAAQLILQNWLREHKE